MSNERRNAEDRYPAFRDPAADGERAARLDNHRADLLVEIDELVGIAIEEIAPDAIAAGLGNCAPDFACAVLNRMRGADFQTRAGTRSADALIELLETWDDGRRFSFVTDAVRRTF